MASSTVEHAHQLINTIVDTVFSESIHVEGLRNCHGMFLLRPNERGVYWLKGTVFDVDVAMNALRQTTRRGPVLPRHLCDFFADATKSGCNVFVPHANIHTLLKVEELEPQYSQYDPSEGIFILFQVIFNARPASIEEYAHQTIVVQIRDSESSSTPIGSSGQRAEVRESHYQPQSIVERLSAAGETGRALLEHLQRRDVSNFDRGNAQQQARMAEELLSTENRKCHVCSTTTRNRCSRCKMTFYCSSECQRRNWNEHRGACPTLKIIGESISLMGSGAMVSTAVDERSRADNT